MSDDGTIQRGGGPGDPARRAGAQPRGTPGTPPRVGLGDLVRAGGRAISRYTGTVFVLYVVQALLAVVAIVALANVYAADFARRPYFDELVDGDLVALLEILRSMPHLIASSAGVIVAIVLTWAVVSWFLTGGLYAVLIEQPEGRAATARCFGAGGANTFLTYLGVAILSLTAHVPVVIALGLGLDAASLRFEYALTLADLTIALLIALGPAFLLLVIVWSIADLARAELALRRTSHELRPLHAYLRAIALIARRPLPLLHALAGWLVIIAIGAGYLWLSFGHAMLGAGGAVTILIVRQGVSLARVATKTAVLAGQLELVRAQAAPAIAPVRATGATDNL